MTYLLLFNTFDTGFINSRDRRGTTWWQ